MALVFYTQRDIANMDRDNIPEEFINYFDGLSEEGKKRIIEARPDLAAALLKKDVIEMAVSTIYNDDDVLDSVVVEPENEHLLIADVAETDVIEEKDEIDLSTLEPDPLTPFIKEEKEE